MTQWVHMGQLWFSNVNQGNIMTNFYDSILSESIYTLEIFY